MKRYLLSIILAVFAIGGIGMGYIYSAIDHLPKYKLATIQGDPKELVGIELSGSYLPRMFSEALTVTAQGSQYYKETESFRKNILSYRGWFLNDSTIQQLVKEYRQFMRGKGNDDGFYNDEQWLIYVDIKNVFTDDSNHEIPLEISLLNKLTKQTKEYEILMDGKNGFYIRDVQLIEDQIHILMSTYSPERESDDIYDFVVNLYNGQLESKDKLDISGGSFIDKTGEEHLFSNYPITESARIAPSDFVIIVEYDEKIISREGRNSYSFERVSEQYYAYSYRTGEILTLPDMNGTTDSISLNNNLFVQAVNNSESIALSKYDLISGESKLNDMTITASDMGITEFNKSLLVANNRLYVFFEKNRIPMVVIVDVQNGEVLYKGEVVFDGPDSEASMAIDKLHLLNISNNH